MASRLRIFLPALPFVRDMEHEAPLDDYLLGDDVLDDVEEIEPSPWRRRIIVAVAAVTVVAVGLIPAYNLFRGQRLDVADNGLEVCGFDYCVVQEAVVDAGLHLEMSAFATRFLDDEGASRLAASLVDHLGVEPVTVQIVDALDGRIEGQYSPRSRLILLERPARAWIVIHEVAHAVSSGHGDDFTATVIELTEWLDEQVSG